MSRLLGAYVLLLGVSEAITIELLRLGGTAIGAGAAVLAAYWSYRGRREARTRRFAVRDPEHEQAVIVDSPPIRERRP